MHKQMLETSANQMQLAILNKEASFLDSMHWKNVTGMAHILFSPSL